MKNMKTATALVVVAILLLAAALNPSADRHRQKITEAISERSELESFFGIGKLTAFASRYSSLGIASYTTVDGKLTSIGVMGMVFVLD